MGTQNNWFNRLWYTQEGVLCELRSLELLLSKSKKVSPSVLDIPFDLTFIFGDEKTGSVSSLPEFKSLSVELIALTVKSKKLPIPVVIHPEMMFDNKTKNGEQQRQF